MEEVRPIDFIRRRILPWVMWGALITLAVWLYRGVGPGSPVKGFAEAQPFRLSSTEPARVESILVRAGDRVRAGEVVAILDATAIDAELRVIEADRARVLAELAKAEMEAKVARFDQTRGIVGDQDQVALSADGGQQTPRGTHGRAPCAPAQPRTPAGCTRARCWPQPWSW